MIGVAAAAVFGLGPLLLGGEFGRIVGASWQRLVCLPDRRCRHIRRRGWRLSGPPVTPLVCCPAAGADGRAACFNGLRVIAAIIEILGGQAMPVAYVILAAAGATTVAMANARARTRPLIRSHQLSGNSRLGRGVAQSGSAPVGGLVVGGSNPAAPTNSQARQKWLEFVRPRHERVVLRTCG